MMKTQFRNGDVLTVLAINNAIRHSLETGLSPFSLVALIHFYLVL